MEQLSTQSAGHHFSRRLKIVTATLAVLLLAGVALVAVCRGGGNRVRFVNQGWFRYESGQSRSIEAGTFRVRTSRYTKFGPILIETGISDRPIGVH